MTGIRGEHEIGRVQTSLSDEKASQTSLSHSLSTHTPFVSADQKSRTLNLIDSTRDSMKLMLSQKGGTYLVTKMSFEIRGAQRCLLASQSCTWVFFRPWYGLRRCPRELKKRVLMASKTAWRFTECVSYGVTMKKWGSRVVWERLRVVGIYKLAGSARNLDGPKS